MKTLAVSICAGVALFPGLGMRLVQGLPSAMQGHLISGVSSTTSTQRVCSLHCSSDNEASDNDDTTLNCAAHEAAVMCYHDNMTLSGAAYEVEVTFPGYIIHGL